MSINSELKVLNAKLQEFEHLMRNIESLQKGSYLRPAEEQVQIVARVKALQASGLVSRMEIIKILASWQ